MKTNGDSIHADILSATSGTIDYPLTNDYMFRSVMQSSENVLKGLLCSLLHLDPEKVASAEILNPIELGRAVGDKEFYLDVKVLMNSRAVINLEMQLRNEHNWSERSLIYLCRLFDNLNSGDDYRDVRPAFQIGILDFTPFPEHPEFYATYQLTNRKNHHKYSDKFTLHVLDLTKMDIATEEDKGHGIDRWARLFKAATWEEFKMICADDKNMKEAGETLFMLSKEARIRYQCEAREEHRRIQNTIKWQMDTYKAALAENEVTIAQKDATIAENEAALAEKDSTIAQNEATIAELRATIARLQAETHGGRHTDAKNE